MAMLIAHRSIHPKVAASALLLLAASCGHAQTLTTPADRLCAQALSNRGARLAIPVLTSLPVREASCACLASAVSGRQAEPSIKALIEAHVGECIARAAPAEKVVPLPSAVLAQLEDAFAREPVARGFSSAKAKLDGCKLPEYPSASRRVEAAGTTRLAFHIGADSSVIDAEVTHSAGSSPAHKLLDVTALFSLMQCKFEPARFRGDPLDAWIEVEYRWKLE